MVRKENTVAVEHLGGGKGTAYVHHIISKEEFFRSRQNVREGGTSSGRKRRLAPART